MVTNKSFEAWKHMRTRQVMFNYLFFNERAATLYKVLIREVLQAGSILVDLQGTINQSKKTDDLSIEKIPLWYKIWQSYNVLLISCSPRLD